MGSIGLSLFSIWLDLGEDHDVTDFVFFFSFLLGREPTLGEVNNAFKMQGGNEKPGIMENHHF